MCRTSSWETSLGGRGDGGTVRGGTKARGVNGEDQEPTAVGWLRPVVGRGYAPDVARVNEGARGGMAMVKSRRGCNPDLRRGWSGLSWPHHPGSLHWSVRRTEQSRAGT